MSRPRLNKAEHRRAAEAWNAAHPIGISVTLTLDDGRTIVTTTRSEAWLLAHGQAVIAVEGKAGGWDLKRIRPNGAQSRR